METEETMDEHRGFYNFNNSEQVAEYERWRSVLGCRSALG